jgi:hypothetical protein
VKLFASVAFNAAEIIRSPRPSPSEDRASALEDRKL